MQYLVQVSGDVLSKQSRTYVVDSSSAENAQVIAAENFCDEFEISSDSVLVKPHARTKKAIIAFAFMLVPILLSFISWKNGHESFSISPSYISCLYSVLLYAAFIVRAKGLQRTVSSWIDILFCVLVVLLLSTFIQQLLGEKEIDLLITKINFKSQMVFPVAIIFSWLGMKFVSLICIAGISAVAIFNMTSLSEAMGMICGPLYIICSFVGIMLYLSVEPAFMEASSQLKLAAAKGMNYLSGDVSDVKNKAINIKSVISKRNEKKEK